MFGTRPTSYVPAMTTAIIPRNELSTARSAARRTATLALTGMLAAGTFAVGASARPATAAGFALTPQPGSDVQILGDAAVRADASQVTVTLRNTSGADVDVDTATFGPVDPADIAAGTTSETQLTAGGISVAQIAANWPGTNLVASTCAGTVLAGDECTVTVETTAVQRAVAGTISVTEVATQVVIGKVVVAWPAIPPANDNWADAIDVSGLVVPPFDGSFTGAGVAGSTVGATQEAGEPELVDGYGDPWTQGTVWYRYESPPAGFAGLLGFEVSSSAFLVTPYASYEPDPYNPFLGLYPDEGPGALDRMSFAPVSTVHRELPGGLHSNPFVARVEPGQRVWFQVAPNPLYPGASPGEFTFRLYHVDDVAERVATAPVPFCVVACGPVSSFAWSGYADTFAASPQPAGPASSWSTFQVAATGTFTVTAQSQKASRRESERPVSVEVFRAPSAAPVIDPAELGAPIASNSGGLLPRVTWLNGQFTNVQQWVAEVSDLVVTPGRYYVRVSGEPTFVGLAGRLTGSGPPPPTVAITAPPAGAAYAVPSDVPPLAYTCTPASGTIASTTVTVDAGSLAAGSPLPTTPGSHSIVVACTDSSGATGIASSSYSVAAPLAAPDRTLTTPEDVARSIDLVAPVVAPPGVTIAVESAGTAAHGTVAAGSTTATYTPATDYSGPDSFTYTLVSSNGQRSTATVSVDVTAVNDAPVGVADTLSTAAGSTIDVLGTTLTANDTDVDGGALTAASLRRAGGTVTGQLVACAPARPDCWKYVAPTTAGTEQFDYTVNDGNGGTATGRLTITVQPATLPDSLLVRLTCPGWQYSISGATTGLTVTRGPLGFTVLSGRALLGTATVNVLVIARGSVAIGTVQVTDSATGLGTTIYPRNATRTIGTTWVMTGTWWRPTGPTTMDRCTFQVNVTDGG